MAILAELNAARALHGADVVIVGGGAIGCACALRLSAAGRSVLVVERGEPGSEATWAAGGIIGAQMESRGPGPMLSLGLASRALYPALARELRETTGIDIGLRSCGVLELAFAAHEEEELLRRQRWQAALGLSAALVSAEFCRESGGSPRALSGLFFAGDGRLDNRLLARALRLAAERAGARFVRASAREVLIENGAATGVSVEETSADSPASTGQPAHKIDADCVVVAAGAWSALLPGAQLARNVVRPVRGQVIALAIQPPFEMVLHGPRGYALPRGTDQVLVGATVEEAGFDKTATQEGTDQMREVAAILSPALAQAKLVDRWAGLRPASADGLLLLGRPRAVPRGLILATGHYRSGILLAPITAELVCDLALGRAPRQDLEPFRPDRPFPDLH